MQVKTTDVWLHRLREKKRRMAGEKDWVGYNPCQPLSEGDLEVDLVEAI